MKRLSVTLAVLTAALATVGCGDKQSTSQSSKRSASSDSNQPRLAVEPAVTAGYGERFNPTKIYREEAPGVVTVISSFKGSKGLAASDNPQDSSRGLGSGFVIAKNGEIATNAHVVTSGEGDGIQEAKAVYVEFGNGNQVPADVVGYDPNIDVALLKVNPGGLNLSPLALGSDKELVVGSPVAAIGSPFGEPQSLSVGVISGLNRSIDSLTGFAIPGAIQTDAAINHGNSGGPLVDTAGSVIGINSQIRSTGGGGEGVGFAAPIDAIKRSLNQLRSNGKTRYGYLGVATVPVFPQLAKRFDLSSETGAYVQEVTPDSPAEKSGLVAGKRKQRFQIQDYLIGGDIIVSVNGTKISDEKDLGQLISYHQPGEVVNLELYRGSSKRVVSIKLENRPNKVPDSPSDSQP